jgi:hypothetical protein
MNCKVCGAPKHVSQRGLCIQCASKVRPTQSAAYRAVRSAIVRGDLPLLRDCRCIDCGFPAQAYDHRDYSRPLEVDAVCWSCNGKRGSAKQLRAA